MRFSDEGCHMKIKRSLATLLSMCSVSCSLSVIAVPTFAYAASPAAVPSVDVPGGFPYQLAFFVTVGVAAVAFIAWLITFIVALRARRLICRDQSCMLSLPGSRDAKAYDFGDVRTLPAALVPVVERPSSGPVTMDTGVQRAVREDAVQHALAALRLEMETVAQAELSVSLIPEEQNDVVHEVDVCEAASMEFTDDMIIQVVQALQASDRSECQAKAVGSAPQVSSSDQAAKIVELHPPSTRRRGSHFRDEADAWIVDDHDPETTAELFDLVQQLMQHAQADIEQRSRRAS
jgi:hypothetical protein